MLRPSAAPGHDSPGTRLDSGARSGLMRVVWVGGKSARRAAAGKGGKRVVWIAGNSRRRLVVWKIEGWLPLL